MLEGVEKKKKQPKKETAVENAEDATRDTQKQTPRKQRDIQMNQTERKLDKTPADQQKERAGGPATIGQRNRTKYTPITVFVLERTASYFPMNLYLQTHTLCFLGCIFMSYFVSRL